MAIVSLGLIIPEKRKRCIIGVYDIHRKWQHNYSPLSKAHDCGLLQAVQNVYLPYIGEANEIILM